MNSTVKAIIWLAAVLIVLVAAYYFIGRPTEGEVIKVGFIGPLTGDAASYGEPERNVVQLAIEEINGAGGVKGKKLEVIYEDGKCNGKDAANAMQKLVSVDKVKVVLGGFCSSESLAAVPIAQENKVFLLSLGSSSPDLTGISTFFARTYPSDASQGAVLAEVAFNQKKWKTVAFVQEQLDYPLGIYKAFSANFEKLGGKVFKEEFPEGTTDFRSVLTKLRAAKPDAVFVDTQTPAAAERVLKQIKDLKWRPMLLISDAVSGHKETVEKNADLLEGALAAEFGVDPTNPKFDQLAKAYQVKHNTELPFQSYSQTEYDGVYMVKDAIEAVGYDAEKIAEWFRTVKDWSGASGLVTIGDDGDRDGGHVPKIIVKGKVEKLQ